MPAFRSTDGCAITSKSVCKAFTILRDIGANDFLNNNAVRSVHARLVARIREDEFGETVQLTDEELAQLSWLSHRKPKSTKYYTLPTHHAVWRDRKVSDAFQRMTEYNVRLGRLERDLQNGMMVFQGGVVPLLHSLGSSEAVGTRSRPPHEYIRFSTLAPSEHDRSQIIIVYLVQMSPGKTLTRFTAEELEQCVKHSSYALTSVRLSIRAHSLLWSMRFPKGFQFIGPIVRAMYTLYSAIITRPPQPEAYDLKSKQYFQMSEAFFRGSDPQGEVGQSEQQVEECDSGLHRRSTIDIARAFEGEDSSPLLAQLKAKQQEFEKLKQQIEELQRCAGSQVGVNDIGHTLDPVDLHMPEITVR